MGKTINILISKTGLNVNHGLFTFKALNSTLPLSSAINQPQFNKTGWKIHFIAIFM